MRIKSILLVFLVIVIAIISCKKTENQSTTHTPKESITKKSIDSKLTARQKVEDRERVDSIRLQNVLDGALEIVYQNIKAVDYSKEYERTVDSAYNVSTKITISSPFIEQQKHVIIRNESPGEVSFNIYLMDQDSLKPVINHKQWGMTYVSDSIADINGDSYKDFIVNWYGSTGCCLKAFSDVYLFQPDKKTFTQSYQFINPTFSAKEKIVRGVCYGHPGETSLYKFAWNKKKIDTLAYISYEKNNKGKKTGKILVSRRLYPETDDQIIKKLNSVPKEYHSIMGYDWFTGDGY